MKKTKLFLLGLAALGFCSGCFSNKEENVGINDFLETEDIYYKHIVFSSDYVEQWPHLVSENFYDNNNEIKEYLSEIEMKNEGIYSFPTNQSYDEERTNPKTVTINGEEFTRNRIRCIYNDYILNTEEYELTISYDLDVIFIRKLHYYSSIKEALLNSNNDKNVYYHAYTLKSADREKLCFIIKTKMVNEEGLTSDEFAETQRIHEENNGEENKVESEPA